MLFTGKYEHSIDSKHRVAIPAELRAQLDPELHGESFYIVVGPNGALWLWPEKTFERMAGNIEPSLTPGEDLMEFDEITFPEARRAEPDKAGRVRLPEEMLAEAGIGTKVVVLGMRNHLELRDPMDWARRREQMAGRRGQIVQRARPEIDRRRDG